MKKNLEYYQHYSNSHNHWKFKMLRSKLGWAAEGRFWALNNMIALSDNCLLDLNRKNLRATVINDLDMTEEEFNHFIIVLAADCELVIALDGIVTSEIVRDNLKEVMKQRERARGYKIKSHSKNENPAIHLLSKIK